MSNVLIEAKGVQKHFKVAGGLLHAVDGVDFTIQTGQTLGVVGESGCGKSTLGRVILRLLDPTGGEIFFDGEEISRLSHRQVRHLRRDMQMIFQDPYSSLNPRMSVQELIAEPILVNRLFSGQAEVMAHVRKMMDTVGLAARLATAYPHELDGGRRQRIGVARALALNPRFIVCDEPVSALDVSIQAQILNLLMDLQDEMNLTYMFITHDLSVVKHISDEIAVMYLGKCVERSSARDLFQNPLHPYTQALLSAIPIPDVKMKDRELEIIKGEVSSPVNPKPGCRFAARCPQAAAECAADQTLAEHAPGHFVACCRCDQ